MLQHLDQTSLIYVTQWYIFKSVMRFQTAMREVENSQEVPVPQSNLRQTELHRGNASSSANSKSEGLELQ